MRERAELVGAELEVDSRPGAGTTVRVSVPVSDEAESPRI
jgi:signal transduction histidine kinase